MKSTVVTKMHDLIDIAVILIAILTRDTIAPSGTFLRLLGAVVFLTGVTVGVFAVRQLRRASPQELLTTGLYRYVRHPYYLGSLMALLGLSAGLLSLWGILLAITVAPLVAVTHAREEERELKLRFGNSWEEYQVEVPFILPSLLRRHVPT
jgi:protein-S-isoprenylcysteine O-methyltransferase Ste14